MKIIIETSDDTYTVNSETTSLKGKHGGARAFRTPVPVDYVVLGEICPPIIYTPMISQGPGPAQQGTQQYKVHIYNCESTVDDSTQIIPYVEFVTPAGAPSAPAPTAQPQVEFYTVGVQNAGESSAFLWYQTINLTIVGLPNSVRHRIFAPFIPAPAMPVTDPAVVQVNFGSILPNGEISLSGTENPGVVYYTWKTITDGTDGLPVDLFLQQPKP